MNNVHETCVIRVSGEVKSQHTSLECGNHPFDLPTVFICKIQSYFFLPCLSYLCFFLNHSFLFKQYFMNGKKCAELAFQLSANKSQIDGTFFVLYRTHIYLPPPGGLETLFIEKSLCCLLPGGRKGGPREPTG